jgi:hypothetical protein
MGWAMLPESRSVLGKSRIADQLPVHNKKTKKKCFFRSAGEICNRPKKFCKPGKSASVLPLRGQILFRRNPARGLGQSLARQPIAPLQHDQIKVRGHQDGDE